MILKCGMGMSKRRDIWCAAAEACNEFICCFDKFGLSSSTASWCCICVVAQELMQGAPEVTNVVEACTVPGRADRLDALLEQLEVCEKALQDYLETKRIAFPRFYFVAPADLLDILSKGSNPQAILRLAVNIMEPQPGSAAGPSCIELTMLMVWHQHHRHHLAPLRAAKGVPFRCRHLPKVFDNVHNLEFRKDAAGEPTKVAVGMYSGEGEYVPFAADCICDGPVELWLQVSQHANSILFQKTGVCCAGSPPFCRCLLSVWLFNQ